jgi:hypothetical protein
MSLSSEIRMGRKKVVENEKIMAKFWGLVVGGKRLK